VNRSAIRPPNAIAKPANSIQRSAADGHAIDGPTELAAAAVSA
jgi:hypothetical protein